MKKLKIGTRVEVIGKCQSRFRKGVVLSGIAFTEKVNIRLEATSDKPACNITILRKNVEAVNV